MDTISMSIKSRGELEINMTLRDSERTQVSRRTILAGAAWSVPVIAFASATPAMAASPGECLPTDTLFNSIGRGIFLSGTIANTNLDNLAEIEAAIAEAKAGTATQVSATANNTLDVNALNAIQLSLTGLGNTLSSILDFKTTTGVLNQHAYAHQNGNVRGASGAVTDNGIIQTNAPSGGWPEIATLNLRKILNQIAGNPLGNAIGDIADLDLSIGAVAGRVALNSLCNPPKPEADGERSAFERDYWIAYVRAAIKSSVVTALASGLRTWAGSNTTITLDVGSLLDTLTGLIPVLGTLANVQASLEVTIDTNKITGTLPGPNGAALQLDLTDTSGNGLLVVDLGSILGNPGAGLNGLAPNTRLFIDQELPTNAVTTIVDDWLDALLTEIVHVELVLSARISLVQLNILEIDATLASIADGTATIELLNGIITLTNAQEQGILSDLLATVTSQLRAALKDNGAVNTALTGVNDILESLFSILEEIVVITVNAQNHTSGIVPDDFADLPTNRYDVAALHIGAVNFLDLLDVFLGRGSAGANTVRS